MKNILIIGLFITIISLGSCRKDFDLSPSTGSLEFSKDTVYLDTVFTNIGSSTYRLKVYNRSNEDIAVPNIRLQEGSDSNFRINVDGINGNDSFNNIQILANDSIYIFVETTIDYNNVSDPIVTDKILFDTGVNEQDVDLVTLVQDAVFLYPTRDADKVIEQLTIDGVETSIEGRYLEDNELHFTNEKPYVIYGYIAVGDFDNPDNPNPKTLEIDAGARLHFHAESGLLVNTNATLKVNGTLDEKVIFEGDRLEYSFSETPGQWEGIWLRNSPNSEINHAVIKNSSVGLLVDAGAAFTNPSLTINNTEVYNNSIYGILGRNTYLEGNNLVINNSGFSSLACTIGGKYAFNHSTIANFWNSGVRQFPALLINNFLVESDGVTVVPADLEMATFKNCIIDGSRDIEFLLDRVEGTVFNYNFNNNLLRFEDPSNLYEEIPELNLDDNTHYQNNIINQDPNFKDGNNNEVFIGENSAGIGAGDGTGPATDLLGTDRTSSPDIGAYQHIIFE